MLKYSSNSLQPEIHKRCVSQNLKTNFPKTFIIRLSLCENFSQRSLGVGLDVAFLQTLLHTRSKISRDSMTNGLKILSGNNCINTETGKKDLIIEGEEIRSDERDTRIIAVERSDEGSGGTTAVIFEMDRSAGEHRALVRLEFVGDEHSAGLGNKLSEELSLSNEEKLLGTGMKMGKNQPARLDSRECKRDIESDQRRKGLTVCRDEFTGGRGNDGRGWGVIIIEGEGLISCSGEDLVSGDGAVRLHELGDEVGGCVAFLGDGGSEGGGCSCKKGNEEF